MANFFTAWLFSKLRAFCIQWIWPIMLVVVPQLFSRLQLACIIENQPILHSSNTQMRRQLEYFVEIGALAFIKSIYAATNQSENERSARHQFPSILSHKALCNASAVLWRGQIKRRNFQTEIETEANKWSKFDGPPLHRDGLWLRREAFEWRMMNLRPVQPGC